MLRLILSPSVGGTAGYLYDAVAALASSDGEAVLIVPEQYSFAAERIVLERLGTADAQRVEVLSFTRLANTVFNSVGWDKGKRLNEAGKILLMSRALEQCADKLTVYARSADSPAVVRELLVLSEEFCQCAISYEDIVSAMNNMEEGLLKDKLGDISLVFSVYDSFVSDGWLDDSRMLTRLKDKLAESGYFKNKTVFFDSFRGFTAQEFGIIGKILTQADDVCVALNAPDLTDVGSDDIFYHTKNTAKKLIKIANSVDVPCAKPVTVNEPNSNAALDALAKDFLSPEADVFEGECGSIAVVAAPDIRSECAFIAAQIKKMLRTGEYRSRDIAVIVRDDKSYIRPMMTALAKCGVPVF